MTTKPMVTMPVARQMYHAEEPFRVMMHCYKGGSDKWWSLEYDGSRNGPVECNHGRHGSGGRREPFRYTINKAADKCAEKLGKGYDYDRRTVSSRPKPQPKQAAPKIKLEGPFALIRLVKKVADDHYKAFDNEGGYLLDLDEKGAQDVVNADPFRIEMQVA